MVPHASTTARLTCFLLFASGVFVRAPILIAQSTAGVVAGSVADEQMAAVPAATVTLSNLDTARTWTMQADAAGEFRFMAIPAGRYTLRAEHSGFDPVTVPSFTLHINDDIQVPLVLRVAGVTQSVTVPAPVERGTSVRRTTTREEIDALPVADRNFANLALLAPGVLENNTNPGSSSPIVAAGQTGRNNTFLLDGLTLDWTDNGNMRGSVPLDAIAEFDVQTGGFVAEFGQANGAIVTMATRSGSNRFAGRGYYYHRGAGLDARSPAAELAAGGQGANYLQMTPGGFLGGPLIRDRAFFFAAAEQSSVDAQHAIVSPVLHLFRPSALAVVPTPTTTREVLGRTDVNLASHVIAVRYRLYQVSGANRFGQADVALGAPERAGAAWQGAQDLALVDTRAFGARRLNDFRSQFSTVGYELGTNCPGCAAENRPSIRLGANPALPNGSGERRWQILDTFTYETSGAGWHDHTLKAGVDVSSLELTDHRLPNQNGTFLFLTDEPFNAAESSTYPFRYTQTQGPNGLSFGHRTYAMFVQEQARPLNHVLVTAGARWDRQSIDLVALRAGPALRLGATVAPGQGTTVLRANAGRYYDQVPVTIVQSGREGAGYVQTMIRYPGYPDPSGPNPSRPPDLAHVVTSTAGLAPYLSTPYSDAATVGVSRTLRANVELSIDACWARGHQLFYTRDLNYPDLTDPLRQRPNPSLQQVLVVGNGGQSWYRALQIELRKRRARSFAWSVGYTWSRADRNTEDFDFQAQARNDLGPERGPSASDVRHKIVATVDFTMPRGVMAAVLVSAHSALPYTITTGVDTNGDGVLNDRPPGVERNSARGDEFFQLDMRVSKRFHATRSSVELLAEAFNLTNRANWTQFVGDESSQLFGRPTGDGIAREVQLGVRVEF
ncbi:MAG: TonB-dependent receptor [Bacteroidales bacterium]